MVASNSPAPSLTRLLKRSEFLELKANGRRVSTPAFVCQWLDKPGLPHTAVGFTASSKGIGNAVLRNRARRRLKAALQQATKGQTITPGKHLAFIAKPPVQTLAYVYLLKDMLKALRQAGVLA